MTKFTFEGRTYDFPDAAQDEDQLRESVAICMRDVRDRGKYPAFTARNADACDAIVACKLVSAATAADLRAYFEQQRRVKDRYGAAIEVVWDLLTEAREPAECPAEMRETVGLLLRRVAAVQAGPHRARHRRYLDRAVASMAFAPDFRDEPAAAFANRVAMIAVELVERP